MSRNALSVKAYLDIGACIDLNYACKCDILCQIIIARSKSAACEAAVKRLIIGNTFAGMYSNDLVRVIAVARSRYCISVSDIAVIGLGFEITALDEIFVIWICGYCFAEVATCDNAGIKDFNLLVKGAA